MTAEATGPSAPTTDEDAPLLAVEDLVVEFDVGGATVHAVSGVSLHVERGETLGLVGESGCGKSTLGRTIMQLVRPRSGDVRFDGLALNDLDAEELRHLRPRFQMIFQDPISSLNPRRRVRDIVREPLRVWGRGDDADDRVDELLRDVGLDPDTAGDRRVHQFSGGQCQRISIARALVLEPQLLICDEPVSALDVSVQAKILNLLEDLKARLGLTMLFIAHDLAVVKSISDRVAVMYLGKLCEVAPAEELYRRPMHPYTVALLDAVPEPDPSASRGGAVGQVSGDLPSPTDPPSGCRFRTRCPKAQDLCADVEPPMEEVAPGHLLACHFPVEDAELEAVAAGRPLVS